MQKRLLQKFSKKYIWWKTPEEALLHSKNRIIAQVMTLGTFEDSILLLKNFDKKELQNVLLNAEAGWFNKKSWHYWHNRLDLPLNPYPEKRPIP